MLPWEYQTSGDILIFRISRHWLHLKVGNQTLPSHRTQKKKTLDASYSFVPAQKIWLVWDSAIPALVQFCFRFLAHLLVMNFVFAKDRHSCILQAGGASPLLFSLSEVGVVIVGINMTILAYLHQNASSSKAFNFKPGCSLFKESLHAPGGIFPGQHKSLALGCCFQGYNPHKKSLTKNAL